MAKKEILQDKKDILFHLILIVALFAVVLPLLVVAPFDRPSADDWSYGKAAYQSIRDGGGLAEVLKSSMSVVRDTYLTWEGRYSCVFFDSFMPGIWNEKFYGITPFILILSLIFCELYFGYAFLGMDNRRYVLPVIVPGLIMQILYVPSIVESFYWYTGAMNYTFINSLSLLFIGIYYSLGTKNHSKNNTIIILIIEFVLAVIIGGGNFSTSLYTLLTIFVLNIIFALRNRKVDTKGVLIFLVLLAGFMITVCAPGNSARISGNFAGQTYDPFTAIWMSVSKTCENIWQWSNAPWFRPVLIMLIPYLCHAVKKMDWSFRLPLLFSLVTVGIYSSQIVATMYVDGTVGGGRSISILLYSYWIWAWLNLTYWIGWIYKKTGFRIKSDRLKSIAKSVYDHPDRIAAFLGIVTILGMCLTLDIKSVSTTRAVKDLVTGRAVGYAREWDDRYELLHDQTQTEIVFRRLENRPETLLYADLEYDDDYIWVNNACANYYGKESITVTLD